MNFMLMEAGSVGTLRLLLSFTEMLRSGQIMPAQVAVTYSARRNCATDCRGRRLDSPLPKSELVGLQGRSRCPVTARPYPTDRLVHHRVLRRTCICWARYRDRMRHRGGSPLLVRH